MCIIQYISGSVNGDKCNATVEGDRRRGWSSMNKKKDATEAILMLSTEKKFNELVLSF